jgi:hypothetical protein
MAQFGRFQIQKSVTRDLGNLNGLHDFSSTLLENSPNIPSLLTELIPLDVEYMNTSTWEHDSKVMRVALPSDKSYSDRGDNFDARETSRTHLFKIPSFGIQTHIRPQDALRSRVAGTKDTLDSMDRLVANDIRDIRRSFALLQEKALAHLITTGTSYVPNGSAPVTDFYTEYAGTSAAARPTVDFKLSDATKYPAEVGEDARALINENLLDGQTVSGYVALCGRNFFRDRIHHPKEEQARVDRTDMWGQDPLLKRLANFQKQYRMYVGADDIVYIQYDAKIGGVDLINTNEAYIMPAGVEGMFARRFAPAETMQYVNTIALPEYAWRSDNEFNGTHIMYESNFGDYLLSPLTIIKATKS